MPVWTSGMSWTSTGSGRRLVETDSQALQWADSRSLLPSLAAGTTACSHPTTDSRTHSGRKPSCTQAEGGPRSQLGGWAPPVAKTTSGSEESIWSRRGLWAPSQPSCLNPPAVPEAGGRRGCLSFIGVIPGPLRGRDGRRGPSSLKMGGVRSLDSPVLGKRRWHQVSGWFSADPASPQRPPILISPCGAWAALQEEGPGAGCSGRGAGLASFRAAGAAHPVPHFCSPSA